MRRSNICLYLGPADRAELQALLSSRNTPRKLAWRAEIVLATADGHGTVEIMRRTGMSKPTVWRWQERYLDEGLTGLKRDKTRPSRVPPLPMEKRLKVIAKTVQETPANSTHWSRALMAEAMGISPSSVGRIWAEAGLKPHLTKGFKISNDPIFEEKVTEIVGLYLHPPDRAVVLCVDEKSQIQALDRTQPGLPLKKGRAATSCWKHASSVMTHDYRRHGTTTLFAALDVKSGLVIGECMPRHRAKEFLTFLRRIDRAVKKPRDIHVVLDNYATHKTPEVRAWLEKHPRFKLHFTPTSASWMNLVERFFAEITAKRKEPDWAKMVAEMKRKGVTLLLLWEEYRAAHPEGYGYTWFCERYRAFESRISPRYRNRHEAGAVMQTDYAGHTIPVVDPATGQEHRAQIFVAVLGASNYTFAWASLSQKLPDWIDAEVRALQFFGGVPKAIVCDNLKAAVAKPLWFEPSVTKTFSDMANRICLEMPAVIASRVSLRRRSGKA